MGSKYNSFFSYCLLATILCRTALGFIIFHTTSTTRFIKYIAFKMNCPSSEGSFFLYHWLKEFFDLDGDHMPNQQEFCLDNMLQVCVKFALMSGFFNESIMPVEKNDYLVANCKVQGESIGWYMYLKTSYITREIFKYIVPYAFALYFAFCDEIIVFFQPALCFH